MTYDNFTIKAQEAIVKGQTIAKKLDQQQVDTSHLLKGIIEVDEQVVSFLCQKMGLGLPSLEKALDEQINKYPKVDGTDKQFLTNDSNAALKNAKDTLKQFNDEFISLELIFLGILKGKDKTAQILRDLGADEKSLVKAIEELRKGSNVNSQHADSSLISNNSNQNYTKVETNTIDNLFKEQDKIKLIKIEAEGFEPEIVKGSLSVLKKTEFICVDGGPERGPYKKQTIEEISNILFENNFEIKFLNTKSAKALLIWREERTTNKLSASLGRALINDAARSIPALISTSSSLAFPDTARRFCS